MFYICNLLHGCTSVKIKQIIVKGDLMKKECRSFIAIIIVMFILLTTISGCTGSKETTPLLSDIQSPDNASQKADSENNQSSDIISTDNIPENSSLSEVDFATVVKYYEYFASHRTRINPLFNFSADKADDMDLMVFAIINLQSYSSENGNTKEEIDAILNKFFGRTVKKYVTGMTEYVPGTDHIRATGWGIDGSNRLVLTKLLPHGAGNFTGYFDVYHIPESYGVDDYQKFYSEIDDILLSGKPGMYAELLRYKAVINFDELPEEGDGFYLRYNNIRLFELESPIWGLYAGYELDERTFNPQTRFAADEASFNGITTRTTKKELTAKLGEPWEVIEKPADATMGTTTYHYAGVEYVFEEDSNIVSYIRVTGFQWKYGPRNLRIGESFEDVLKRFPQEQNYKTHPNGCFYGETTYQKEGGAVYYNTDGSISNITVVPKGVLPFLKIYFQDGIVSEYYIMGYTT